MFCLICVRVLCSQVGSAMLSRVTVAPACCRRLPLVASCCSLLPLVVLCCSLLLLDVAYCRLSPAIVSRNCPESSVVSAAQPRERREADSSLVAGVVFGNASHAPARASRCPTVWGHASDCFEAPVRLAPFPFHANKGFGIQLLSRTYV